MIFRSAQAVVRVGRRSLTGPALVAIAATAFAVLTLTATPFPLVVLGAGLAGFALRHHGVTANEHGDDAETRPPLVPDDALHAGRPTLRRSLTLLGAALVAWGVPMAAVVVLTGGGSTLTDIGVFFSGTALVTFGGAYAVLAFVAQRAVEVYGWLGPGEMVRGLALAESTPGPLIMVVQFVGFVGAYRHPGGLDPWVAALIGAALTTWVTFVPSFLLVLLGAPWMERLRGNASLGAALAGVTAAVVGVIAHLALYFATHTLFADTASFGSGLVRIELPDPTTPRLVPWLLAALAASLLLGRGWSVLRVLGLSAALGVVAGLLGAPVA